jgi:adenylylsulfate kinase-like enzyme
MSLNPAPASRTQPEVARSGPMIVWINGAFGAGKTTTADLVIKDLVIKRLDGERLFDPEYVGYLLMRYVEPPTGDFQGRPPTPP